MFYIAVAVSKKSLHKKTKYAIFENYINKIYKDMA